MLTAIKKSIRVQNYYNNFTEYNNTKRGNYAVNGLTYDVFQKKTCALSFGTSQSKEGVSSNNILNCKNVSFENKLQNVSAIYKKFIEETPFSDLPKIYVYLNEKTPPNLKDNTCVGMSDLLKGELEKAGYKNNYFLRGANSTHFCLASEIDGQFILLDSQMLLEHPINLTQIKNSANKQKTLNLYPVFTQIDGSKALGTFTVKFIDENIFEAGMKNPGIGLSRTLSYDLNKKIKEKPGILYQKEVAFDKNHKSFTLRVFDEETKDTVHLVYPHAKYFESKIADKNNLYIRTSERKKYNYGSKEFEKYLNFISQKLKLSVEEITDYVINGVKLHYQHAPKDFRF